MKNRAFFLIAALMLGLAPLAANAQVGNPASSSTSSSSYCGVSYEDIYNYVMVRTGAKLTSVVQVPASCNVLCQASNGHTYIVYITDGIITGMEDVDA
ncbi:MAG TPA: hypothetical protein VI731_02250 [Bacteroidia bacterium]|nr:hypothetical protein [Bacteroidia bacterium]